MKVVMSYSQPDLDGISCMYAYSEFLNKQGEKADYAIWNEPKQEVKIVCDMFGIKLKGLKIEEIPEDSEFVIVDLNGKEQIHDIVESKNIVEIIDHHAMSKWLQSYINLKRMQIDRLGAAATIVTERYKESGLIPSREAAILLFYGIISNSINLKSNITNQRDVKACDWLKSICSDISEEKIKEIFIKKSYIEDGNLRSEMECEIPNVFPNFKVIVAQLEIADLDKFLKERKSEIISIMQRVKQEKKVDFIFINCVDILNGYIIVFGADDESNEFVFKTYGYEFNKNNEARIDKIIQRKDMTKILREKYN